MDKLLTIVIPTYNMEKYLRHCLDSLIIDDKELLKQYEVLVIIDGSKDSSSTIGHEYEDNYPQTIRVIDKENGNYGSCVNRGLSEAQGKYIKILDADDYFNTKSLEFFLEYLETCDADMIVTDFSIVNEKYEKTMYQGFSYPRQELLHINNYCCSSDFCGPMSMHAVTYKTSILKQMNYRQTTGVPYTDQEWVFEPIIHMDSFIYLPLDLYQYLVGRDGQTVAPDIINKNSKVMISLLLKRVSLLNDICQSSKISINKLNFLKEKLLISATSLYRLGILGGNIDENLLREFDKTFKLLNTDVYDMIGNDKRNCLLGFNYVRAWRKNNIIVTSLIRIIRKIK